VGGLICAGGVALGQAAVVRLGLVEHHQRRLEADGWSGIELVLLLSHLVSAEEPATR